MSKWERRRYEWQFIDSTGRIAGLVKDSSDLSSAEEWSASVCPIGERAEKYIGRYVSEGGAKKAVESWWEDKRTSRVKP